MERLRVSLQLDTENNMSRDDYIAAQEDEADYKEAAEAQEEAHQHHTANEFSGMILSLGPNAVLALLTDEARSELRKSIIIQYNHRLVETSGL
jgi:hypothetical protein